jgi:hypothetical protein
MKPFVLWEPLRILTALGFVIFLVGQILQQRYPVAGDLLTWIGMPLWVVAITALIIKKRSGRL